MCPPVPEEVDVVRVLSVGDLRAQIAQRGGDEAGELFTLFLVQLKLHVPGRWRLRNGLTGYGEAALSCSTSCC